MPTFTFRTIDVSAPVGTYTFIGATGVDAAGEAVGYYGYDDGNGDGYFHGFTATTTNGVTFDPAGSTNTNVVGITAAGEVFGDYVDNVNKQHGFVDNAGVVQTVDVFLANSTTVSGISAGGVIFGEYVDSVTDTLRGFTDSNGTFAEINVAGSASAAVVGINAAGVIVGTYTDTNSVAHGFATANGVTTTIDGPGAVFTSIVGISDAGEIVGNYQDSANNIHGFVDDNGVITTINIAGATSVRVSAINAAGEIVGSYVDGGGNIHGFVDINGVTAAVNGPGATETDVLGVSASGEITGYYNNGTHQHGFVADSGPIVTVSNLTATHNESFAASSLFTYIDPSGAAATEYDVQDTGSGGGHFLLNGTALSANQDNIVTAAALPQLTYQSGSGADTLEVRAFDGTTWSDWASFTVTAPVVNVIETDGATSLTEIGNQFFLYDGGGSGPVLRINGADFTAGEFGGWTPVGAEQTTGGGYEVALQLAGTNQFSAWQTDANGNYVSNILQAIAGTDPALEALETSFHQDLNGDGSIGPPPTVIEADGSTELAQVGNDYVLYATGGTSGPVLKISGADFTVGEFGGWTPVGAEQTTGGGYEVALQLAGTNQFSVWSVAANGNYVSNILQATAGTDPTLESLEPSFHQDLNGDGNIGAPTRVIEADGSTELAQVGNDYVLYATGGTSGPVLKISGADFTVGEFGGWTPVAAEQTTGGGYEVALQLAGTNQFSVWSTDADGNYVSNILQATAGTDTALESLEPSFHQDLNGDGSIGAPTTVIEADGSTELAQVGNDYVLYAVGSTSGPVLKISGADFTVGEFGGWTPVGAEQTTGGGYEVALQLAGTNQFSVWQTDANGNYVSNILQATTGADPALESLEPGFHQDLNGDGSIGVPTRMIESDGSTELAQVGNDYVLYADGGTSGPVLKISGADFTLGEFGGWTPVGAEQTTGGGYEVALQLAGTNQFSVWQTDANGNYVSNLLQATAGTSTALEALELGFHQDFNGDGTIGVPGSSDFSLQYKGFDYVSFYNGGYENADSLPTLVQTGANSIETTLEYGIDVQTSQVVTDPNYTDSLTALGHTIAQAESLGLSVVVRPLIDFLDPSEIAPYSVGDWRQDYQPTNVSAFFSSYKQMIVAEAEVAQQNGAQMLSIGAELDQLAGPQYLSYWTDIISSVRAVFSGALTYSASWDTASQVSFWSELNYEGIDCYVPLSNAANPTLQNLIDGWTKAATPSTNPGAYAEIGNESPIQYFENLAAESGKPLIFTELGYANDSGAAADPSASGSSPDPTLQGELYQAFFQAWAQSGNSSLVGTYFWEWDPDGNPSNVGPAVDSFSPQNDPAQAQATAGFETPAGNGGNAESAIAGTVDASALTFNSDGALALDGGRIVGSSGGETLNNSGHTITGYGAIGDGSGHLTLNNAGGTIAANGGTLILDTGNAIAHAGMLEAEAGATLRIDDAVTDTAASATIGTGATLEIAANYAGAVHFEAATGTLILDHGTTFGGEIFGLAGNGSLSGSDQIDLKDILFGTGTTASFTGNASGGELTVSDAQHDTANIMLSGDYQNSTFSVASDGHGGTSVIDPAAAQDLANGTFSFNDADTAGQATASVSAHNDGAGYVGTFTIDAVTTANGQDSVAWHFDVDPNSVAQTVTQSYDVTLSSPQSNGTTATASQAVSVTVGGQDNDAFVFKPGLGNDVVANATSASTIELDGFAAVTSTNQLATLLNEAQTGQAQPLFEAANGGHDTVIDLGNHDSVTLVNVHIADLHASNFLIG